MALIEGMEALARTVARSRARDETPRLMWGQVAAAGPPATVVLDGDQSSESRPVSGSAVGLVAAGQRVLLARQGRRLWIVNAPPASWRPLALLNGWENYGGSYAPAGYRVTTLGLQFRGLIQSGTDGLIAMLSLPASSRAHVLNVRTQAGGTTRLDVLSSGRMEITDYTSGWVSLSSLPIIPLD